RVEHGGDLPRIEVARPRHDATEALRLHRTRERLRHQDRVDLLALERLHGGGHGLQRHDPHVGEREAFLLEDVADVVVERGAELGHPDAPALEVLDRPQPAVPQLLLHHDRHQRVAGPLAALVGHDPQLLAAQHDVVERGGEAGGAHVELAGGQRGGDRRGGLEVDQLRLHAELLEEPLLHSHEDRRGRRELQHSDLDRPGRGLGLRAPGQDGGGGERQDQQGDDTTTRHGHSRDPPLGHHGSSGTRLGHQVWRQRITTRSSAPRAQYDATPSSESTTMPTMSWVVSIRLPDCKIRKPMPASAAICSAATSRSSAVPAPSLSPAKTMGKADGTTTFRITLHRPAPNETAARISKGSAWRTPAYVLMAIGKNTPSAITEILDASPRPSHRIRSGRSAIFGIGNVAAIRGWPTAS